MEGISMILCFAIYVIGSLITTSWMESLNLGFPFSVIVGLTWPISIPVGMFALWHDQGKLHL